MKNPKKTFRLLEMYPNCPVEKVGDEYIPIVNSVSYESFQKFPKFWEEIKYIEDENIL